MTPIQVIGRPGADDSDDFDATPRAASASASAETISEGGRLCVVCFVNEMGWVLQPCGHDNFCERCARRFRTCPLCRLPVSPLNHAATEPSSAREQSTPRDLPAERPILSINELSFLATLTFALWIFIWLGSYFEWSYQVPMGYDSDMCEHGVLRRNRGQCEMCRPGFINAGAKCFERLEDLPSVTPGARFSGTFYFVLIIATQLCGAITEVVLIQRLRRRGVMPRKELVILGTALVIEVCRMLLVDLFVLRDYFNGEGYRIFRAPVRCDDPSEAVAWIGSDGARYCMDVASVSYYIATDMKDFTDDTSLCSTFMATSPLLDYGRRSEDFALQFWPGKGHARFSRLGWMIGGEFAFYYFFATLTNEVADNLFVIPTTTRRGGLCKLFSIALEVFQLGALCPAAIFSHGGCLHYTDPLGVPLWLIRDITIWFGYCIAVVPFFALPLAVVGCIIAGSVICLSGTVFELIARPTERILGSAVAESLGRLRTSLKDKLAVCTKFYIDGMGRLSTAVMMFAFIPLLLTGMLLGSLVVVGQASKRGGMEVLTAIILVSDVLFKILATVITELADYALHLRVRRAIGSSASQAHGTRPRQ